MHTSTQIEFLVDAVDATGQLVRSSIPTSQASTPELAVATVRQFCRPSECWPLQSVTHVGTRTTVLTMSEGAR
jgi:hypothetical protein